MNETINHIPNALIVIGIILLVIVIVIAIFASKNIKTMNNCINISLDVICKEHKLTKIPEKEYGKIKLNPLMIFDVDHYQIDDIGNLSVMKLNAGIMQMATFVLTPDKKDIPVLSADYIFMLSIRKVYLEIYNLVINNDYTYKTYINKFKEIKNHFNDIKDMEYPKTWYSDLIGVGTYKQCNSKDDDRIAKMLAENVELMLNMAYKYPILNKEEVKIKQQIITDYSNGLIEKGGVSTNVFKKSLGEETTKVFFDKVFFGTASNV